MSVSCNFIVAVNCEWTYRYIVETMGSFSVTYTAQAADRSGLMTLIVSAPRHSWVAVVTAAGVYITVHMLRMSPSPAWMTPLREVGRLCAQTTDTIIILLRLFYNRLILRLRRVLFP